VGHPARYTLLHYSTALYLFLMRSVDALQISCAHVWYTIRKLFGQLLTMVFCSGVVGRNVLYCMRRFNGVLSAILSEEFDAVVWKHAIKDISDEQEQSVSLLKECILLRDSALTLPDIFTVTDIEHIITEVCSVS